MSASGQTTTYTNARSCAKGREGNGLNVAWRRAYFRGSNSGATHGGVSNYRDDFGEDWEDWRNRIHFARIYGREESFAFRDQSVKDYVFMHVQKGKEKAFNFRVRAWKNLGEGGTKLEADGNKYCNMHGWEDGREDYVWAWSTGELDCKSPFPKSKSARRPTDMFECIPTPGRSRSPAASRTGPHGCPISGSLPRTSTAATSTWLTGTATEPATSSGSIRPPTTGCESGSTSTLQPEAGPTPSRS